MKLKSENLESGDEESLMPKGVYKRTAASYGHKAWNKDLTKETDPRVASQAAATGAACKGRKAWNEGLTKETDSRVAKNAAATKEAYNHSDLREKARVAAKKRCADPVWLEKHRGENNVAKRPDVRKKISFALTDKPKPWMVGEGNPMKRSDVKEKHQTAVKEASSRIEAREKHRVASNKRYEDPEERTKASIAAKKSWQDPIFIAKQIKALHSRPNKPEKFLEKLLNIWFPDQIKYTGSGGNPDYIIGRRNPDFMFVDGQKKVIEFNGEYFHSEAKTGRNITEEEQQRIKYFARYGFLTLIVWEYELKDLTVLYQKLQQFKGTE